MKKKILATILTCAILVTPASTFADMIDVAVNPVSIFVKGLKINKENFILDGTTYVPLRAISESLGMDVQYDEINHSIYIEDNNDLSIASQIMILDTIDNYTDILLTRLSNAELEFTLLAVSQTQSDGSASFKELSATCRTTYDIAYQSLMDAQNLMNSMNSFDEATKQKINYAELQNYYNQSILLYNHCTKLVELINNFTINPTETNMGNFYNWIKQETLSVATLNDTVCKLKTECIKKI